MAAHPQLPPELRDTLAADPNASVRVVIFGRADTPEPLRAAIHAGIQALSAQPDTLQGLDADDPAPRRKLDNYTARMELRYLKLDWVTADPLSHVDSPYPCFRASAAACASLPPDVVTRLLNDVDIDVVTTMVRHAPHLVDLATAERVARQFRHDRPTAWHPADDCTFPPDVLRRFAVDPDHSVRHAVANHRNLPTPALIGLLSDENESVAHAAAGSPYLPTEQMERLLALADL